MSSIKLSPKHGLNPVIATCFFCGESKNEIALLGKINKEDDEAPMYGVIDYEPCDKCKEMWSKGVALIEVTTTPTRGDTQPQIAKGAYPTSRFAVVKPEALNVPMKIGDRALVLKSDFEQLFS